MIKHAFTSQYPKTSSQYSEKFTKLMAHCIVHVQKQKTCICNMLI